MTEGAAVTVHALQGDNALVRDPTLAKSTITVDRGAVTFVSDDVLAARKGPRAAPAQGPDAVRGLVRAHVTVGRTSNLLVPVAHLQQLLFVTESGGCAWRGRPYRFGNLDVVWPREHLQPLEAAGLSVRDETFASKVEMERRYAGSSPHARWTVFPLNAIALVAAVAVLAAIVLYLIG